LIRQDPLGPLSETASRKRRAQPVSVRFRPTALTVALVAACFGVACSSDDGDGTPETGGTTATGGAGAAGKGGATANGGTVTSGGSTAPGGAGNGGAATTGGAGTSGMGGATGGSGGQLGTGGQLGSSGGSAGAPGSGGSGGSGGADSGTEPPLPESAFVYVSGTNGGQGVIALYELTYTTRALRFVQKVNAGTNASFLSVDVARRSLYVADEGGTRVRQLSLDAATWVPSASSDVAATGNPVHVTTTRDGRFVLTAQYNEAKTESFPVTNGKLGSSLGARSTGGQAHAAVLSPDERFLFVPCKAADHVERFSFDKSTGQIMTPAVLTETAKGAGPRHLAFHPNGRFAYLVTELSSSVYAYAYTADSGALGELQRASALPDGFSGTSAGAEIFVTPSGHYLYASNRVSGQNGSLAGYRIGSDGKLTLVGHQSTGGQAPRSFAIDPTERLVIAANQDSKTVAVLALDVTSGNLGTPVTTDVGLNPSFVGIVVAP
jgi:6-phosphogluconolactonase